ncbi:MAG: substrate-binding domain-containing protein [Clostridia bacterium]|nr:substrate-binding domain-containing protein [Clostridia bacterium]
MKKALGLILSASLMLSAAMPAFAQEGITLWPTGTVKKVVKQSDELGEYGKHVGRPQPATTSTQPVVDKALPEFVPQYAADELTGSRVMKCSDVLAYIAHDFVDTFNQYYPHVDIDLSEPYVGSAGAAELIAGNVDFVMVSREPRPNEYPDFKEAFGYDMSVVPVMGGSYNYFGWLDAMCFVVNKDNPIEYLTMEQIDSIFSTSYLRGGHDVETWGDLGVAGEFAELPITRYAITHWNGFEEFVRIRCLDALDGHATDNLFATQGAFREDMVFNSKVFDQANLVKNDRTGIAYTGIAYVDEDVKVLPIMLDDGTIVSPSYEDVCSAKWPLARLVYLNYNKAPDEEMDPVIHEFLRFLLSKNAAEIVSEQNIYVPLTAKQANDARDTAGLAREDFTVMLDGQALAQSDPAVYYEYVTLNKVMYLPLFETLDALDATYTYTDDANLDWLIECGDIRSDVKIGSKFIEVNDVERQISLNSKTWNDCVYMPTDAIDMMCGTTTTYDLEAKVITIAR